MSQSLWVRDRFLMFVTNKRNTIIASQSLWVRDRFLINLFFRFLCWYLSQSLWVRDRFLIKRLYKLRCFYWVAIPLGQGQVFNYMKLSEAKLKKESQSLWVRDRFLIVLFYISTRRNLSQSLWVRDRFLIQTTKTGKTHYRGRNPFGSGTGF